MKVLVTIFLFFFVFFIFGYIGLYTVFNLTDSDNSANVVYRKKVLPYPLARKLLRLHQVGDARFDYGTGKQFNQIKIYIYQSGGQSLDPGSIEKIISEMNRVTTKPMGITLESSITIEESFESVSNIDLKFLAQKYSPVITSSAVAPLSIFVLSTYAHHPTNAGIVEDDRNIFIFKDAISDVSDRQASDQDTEVSTVLHEFAHLLGAEHIDADNCILSEKVENTTFFNLPSIITDHYCDIDLDEIQTALSPG